jgi:hypothetical protein
MTKPIATFDAKNTCPHCHEMLRLVALRSTTKLLQRRYLLICSSAICSYSAGIDAKNVSTTRAALKA